MVARWSSLSLGLGMAPIVKVTFRANRASGRVVTVIVSTASALSRPSTLGRYDVITLVTDHHITVPASGAVASVETGPTSSTAATKGSSCVVID